MRVAPCCDTYGEEEEPVFSPPAPLKPTVHQKTWYKRRQQKARQEMLGISQCSNIDDPELSESSYDNNHKPSSNNSSFRKTQTKKLNKAISAYEGYNHSTERREKEADLGEVSTNTHKRMSKTSGLFQFKP